MLEIKLYKCKKFIYIYIIKYFRGPLIERSVGKASMLGITHTTGLGLIAYAHNSALEAKNPSQVFEAYIFFNSIAFDIHIILFKLFSIKLFL